jgi:D-alanyl-D-alanine carboxypeptidase
MLAFHRRLIVTAILMMLSSSALAQANPSQPDPVAFDQIGQKVFADQQAPGFAFLVWSHGSVVFAKGYGFSDVASKGSVSAETRFAIGSITKQFTAASILMLAQQNKLSLDDKLARYLPEMPNADKITLRMLLNQDSGLHNYPNTREHSWPREGSIPPETLIAILKTDKPDFAPGEQWEYSNTNYAVLAYIVAKVSGISYSDFLARNIFTPVGMSSSGNGFAAQAGIATPYEGSDGNFHPAQPKLSLDLFYGAGSIVSTVQDLAKWDAALIGNHLLNADSMHALWTDATLPNGQPMNYAMGFAQTTLGGHREIWHNGYSPKAGGYCLNAIFPDDQLAVVILSNVSDGPFREETQKLTMNALALYDPKIGDPKVALLAPAASTPPLPLIDDPAVNALAKKLWDQITSNKLDRSLLNSEMNAAMTPELLARVGPQFQPLGTLQSLRLSKKTALNGGTNYLYVGNFTSGEHKIDIFMTADGKVGGYRVLP